MYRHAHRHPRYSILGEDGVQCACVYTTAKVITSFSFLRFFFIFVVIVFHSFLSRTLNLSRSISLNLSLSFVLMSANTVYPYFSLTLFLSIFLTLSHSPLSFTLPFFLSFSRFASLYATTRMIVFFFFLEVCNLAFVYLIVRLKRELSNYAK